ncbi:MAG: hypothetical protein AAGG48_11080 [Planctomycetota bacterium]
MKSEELIHRYFHGLATEDQVRELERRMQSDVRLQDEFLLQAEIDTHLRQETIDDIEGADESQNADQASNPATKKPAKFNRRFVSLGAIGLAASILFALFLLQVAGGQNALAAIERSLDAASEMTTREYRLQVEYQPPVGETFTIDHVLYVQGYDRFALRLTGLIPRRTTWIGQNGSEYWVVPPRGRILKGDNRSIHSRWIRSAREEPEQERELNEVPLTNVTTLLRRMSQGHELEMLEDESLEIADGSLVQCQRIRARRESSGRESSSPSDRPDVIELWASRQTGTAIRVQAHWNLTTGQVGKKTAILSFQREETSLPDDWFSAEGHLD